MLSNRSSGIQYLTCSRKSWLTYSTFQALPPKSRLFLAAAAALFSALAYSPPAHAHPVNEILFYTRYKEAPNVKKVPVSFDGETLKIGVPQPLASLNGADGITFTADGSLVVGGQGDRVHRLRPDGSGDYQTVSAGGGQAFHVTVDPDGSRVWTSGMPSALVEVPLEPLGDGRVHSLSGDDDSISGIAFDNLGRAFYTASDHRGGGNFGILDLTTMTTQRLISDLEAAHGISFDPFTGDLLLFGGNQLAQIDPRRPGEIKSSRTFDLDKNFDQGTPDGQGHLFVGRTTGHLVFVDYAASRSIGHSSNIVAVEYLDRYLDDIAPLVIVTLEGAENDRKITSSGGEGSEPSSGKGAIPAKEEDKQQGGRSAGDQAAGASKSSPPTTESTSAPPAGTQEEAAATSQQEAATSGSEAMPPNRAGPPPDGGSNGPPPSPVPVEATPPGSAGKNMPLHKEALTTSAGIGAIPPESAGKANVQSPLGDPAPSTKTKAPPAGKQLEAELVPPLMTGVTTGFLLVAAATAIALAILTVNPIAWSLLAVLVAGIAAYEVAALVINLPDGTGAIADLQSPLTQDRTEEYPASSTVVEPTDGSTTRSEPHAPVEEEETTEVPIQHPQDEVALEEKVTLPGKLKFRRWIDSLAGFLAIAELIAAAILALALTAIARKRWKDRRTSITQASPEPSTVETKSNKSDSAPEFHKIAKEALRELETGDLSNAALEKMTERFEQASSQYFADETDHADDRSPNWPQTSHRVSFADSWKLGLPQDDGATANPIVRLWKTAVIGLGVLARSVRSLPHLFMNYANLANRRLTKYWMALLTGIANIFRSTGDSSETHSTALVGRKPELASLLARWEQAKTGEGQVVLISGQTGIGKSRLTEALQDEIGDEPYTLLLYHSSPHHTNSALHPVIENLERAMDFSVDDNPNIKLDKLEATLTKSGTAVKDAAPLVASLLSIPAGGRYPPIEVSSQRRKELTLVALVDQLVGLAEKQPVLFVVEDVDWMDPTTLELLKMVIARISDHPVLMVITHRPEFADPWTNRSNVTQIPLGNLNQRESAKLAERAAAPKKLSKTLRNRIAEQADGAPLHVEELTNLALKTPGPKSTAELPTSLQDVLKARLDRLGTAKEIAQAGAVIGRTFSYELMATVTHLDDNTLRSALAALVRSKFVTVRGKPPIATYDFKSALVQDTAYASLDPAQRKDMHRRVAYLLKEKCTKNGRSEPELLAHHFTEAGLIKPAIAHRLAAGRESLELAAKPEAVAHLKQGLELLTDALS